MPMTYNLAMDFCGFLTKVYGEFYSISILNAYHGSIEARFVPKDTNKQIQRFYIPCYMLENNDAKGIIETLNPYLIRLTIEQSCAIMEKALNDIKYVKKG